MLSIPSFCGVSVFSLRSCRSSPIIVHRRRGLPYLMRVSSTSIYRAWLSLRQGSLAHKWHWYSSSFVWKSSRFSSMELLVLLFGRANITRRYIHPFVFDLCDYNLAFVSLPFCELNIYKSQSWYQTIIHRKYYLSWAWTFLKSNAWKQYASWPRPGDLALSFSALKVFFPPLQPAFMVI